MKNIIILSASLFFALSPHVTAAFNSNLSAYQAAIAASALHQTTPSPHSLKTITGAKIRLITFTTDQDHKISDKKINKTIWVITDAEMKAWCKQYKNTHLHQNSMRKNLNLRIAQLLGLPAKEADRRLFVRLEAPVVQAYYGQSPSKTGLFRPCTDPRIGPHGDGTAICPKQMDPKNKHISSDFKTWFINQSISAYTLPNGAPWTAYGYTYDWNKKAADRHGLSEFIVLKNTPINMLPNPKKTNTAYISAEEYCGL